MQIRAEGTDDHDAIDAVNQAAFPGAEEAWLVRQLRDDGLLVASLVAVDDGGEIVGHILFSQVEIVAKDGQKHVRASLAPMSVVPRLQRSGIGSALVRAGIEACRAAGHSAIIVVGHPDYYPRFGFSHEVVAHLETPYPGDAFMGLELVPGSLTKIGGRVEYPQAFSAFE